MLYLSRIEGGFACSRCSLCVILFVFKPFALRVYYCFLCLCLLLFYICIAAFLYMYCRFLF